MLGGEKSPEGGIVGLKVYSGKKLSNEEKAKINKVKVREIFWHALLGEIHPKKVEEMFESGSLTYSHLAQVPLHPLNIIHILEKYLQEEINEDFVKEWALFVLMMDCYRQPNDEYCDVHSDDAADDKYEPMWYVIQQLSAPEIDYSERKLTPQQARKHIEELYEFMRKTP